MGAQCAGGLWMFGGLHHSSKASEEFHGDFIRDFMVISWGFHGDFMVIL
jgi:hypothetical protein